MFLVTSSSPALKFEMYEFLEDHHNVKMEIIWQNEIGKEKINGKEQDLLGNSLRSIIIFFGFLQSASSGLTTVKTLFFPPEVRHL